MTSLPTESPEQSLEHGRGWIFLIDVVVLAVAGVAAAQAFTWLLHHCQSLFLVTVAGNQPRLGLPTKEGLLHEIIGSRGVWGIPLATTLGGLLSGVIVYGLAPEAEGHGTDAVVGAFHRMGGYIRARVPFVKMVASAITIGSGGSAGQEGPIALISAGVGSIYAGLFHRSERHRRLLVLIGMAAGFSAIFRSPIGSAFFAVEVLYSDMEFEAGALLYVLLAAVIAYALNGAIVGWAPLFRVPDNLSVTHMSDFIAYAVLGLTSGILGGLLPNIFYRARDAFRALPIPPHFKPAIGGLAVGLLGLKLPQILGGGYGWIQEAIDGHIVFSLLGLLVFAKMIALSLTVSSGGSGGVFAPGLFMGAMWGGFLAHVFHMPTAAMAVVGMAAVFGGAARVPIATMFMVTEMTNGYDLLVPTALAVIFSFLVQDLVVRTMKYKSLYEQQVSGRINSPAHMAGTLLKGGSSIGGQ